MANDRYHTATLDAGDDSVDPDFPVFDDADVVVLRTRAGVRASLVLDTDYGLEQLGDVPGPVRIQLLLPAEAGDVIETIGLRPAGRTTEALDGNRFSDAMLNDEFDNLALQAQEARRDVDRAWKSPYGVEGKGITPAPLQFARFNAAGDIEGGGNGGALSTDVLFKDHGLVAGGTVTFDRADGLYHRVEVGGALTFAVAGWAPENVYGELVIEIVNGGAHDITWPTVAWLTANEGEPHLSDDGTDFVVLFSRSAGAIVWGNTPRTPTPVNSSDGSVQNMMAMTQAQYDGLTPKPGKTLILILD